jgi:hypothetical protein
MKYTMTFTEAHEAELKRIAELPVFAAKIAQTILSKEVYRASAKQVDILMSESEIEFFISNDYADSYEEAARARARENRPSSMR